MVVLKSLKKEVEYRFNLLRRSLLFLDITFSVIILLFFGIFRPDYVVITAYFLVIPYLFFTHRRSFLYQFIIASGVSLIWMFIAKGVYNYNYNFITILGFNLFPLFSWAIGLSIVQIIYLYYEPLFKNKHFSYKLLVFVTLYWPILIFVETVAYHIFHIQNLATAKYTGLIFCNCIHAPTWVQISYFLIGPIFFIICSIINFKSPYSKIYHQIKQTVNKYYSKDKL